MKTKIVYLLHIEPRYKHAGHYLGSTNDVDARVREHLDGRGSPLIRAAIAAGCDVSLVRTWAAARRGRKVERRLKDRKEAPQLCPRCNPHAERLATEASP